MREDLKKFEELVKTDMDFQQKLKAAADSYAGEQTEEAIFNGVLVPVGKEYGINVSFEEFSDYMKEIASRDDVMDDSELQQVAAGGKGSGVGITWCTYIGIGGGSGENEKGQSACFVIGGGSISSACMATGTTS